MKNYLHIIYTFCFLFFQYCSLAQTSLIDSLSQVLISLPDTEEKTKVLLKLSFEFNGIDPEKSEEYADQAVTLSERLNYKEGMMEGYFRQAGIYATAGQLERALEGVAKSEEIAIETKDTFRLMRYYWIHCAYHSLLGDLDKGMEVALEHLRLARLTGDIIHEANALSNLGYLNGDGGSQDYDKALEYYQRTAAIYDSLGQERDYAFALLNMSGIYEELGNKEAAIEYGLASLEILEKLKDYDLMLTIYANLGKIYYEEGKIELGIDYVRQAANLSNLVSNVEQECRWVLKLAQYLNEQGQYEEAIFHLKRVNELRQTLDVVSFNQPYYEQLALAQKGVGLYENAFENYALSMSWKDSSYQEKKLKELEEIQTKYETEQKEQENQFLSQQNEFLEAENQLYTYIAIGLVLIIAILSWLFYRLRQQNRTIQIQKAKLESLNATKDRLFAIIAHDMRNAVHSFKDVTDSINFFIKKNQPERIQKIAGAVEQSIDQLGRLLDNLLEWALVQRGDMPYQPEYLNLVDSIKEVLDNFEGMAERKEIALNIEVPEQTQIFADKKALETVLRNLLSNALKYSNTGGFIDIKANSEEDKAFIEIKDNGVGMNEEQLKKLFVPAKNKSRKGTAGEKGSGLGMVLVKELVELNKGRIRVEAKEGQGTSFVFTVPSLAA